MEKDGQNVSPRTAHAYGLFTLVKLSLYSQLISSLSGAQNIFFFSYSSFAQILKVSDGALEW